VTSSFFSANNVVMLCSVDVLYYVFDVRRSVHHSIIYIENPTRCNSVSKFYII